MTVNEFPSNTAAISSAPPTARGASLFSARNVTNIATYSVISGIGLTWLFADVIPPLIRTAPQSTLQYLVATAFDLLIAVLVFGAIVHNVLDLISSLGVKRQPSAEPNAYVTRFTLGQRIEHVWILTTFMVLAFTGFAQMYYESGGRVFVQALGGSQNIMTIHIVTASVMGMIIAYHALRYGVPYILGLAHGNARTLAIFPTKKDVSDFVEMLRYYLLRREQPAQFGRFNYGQKFDYWGVYWGIIILGIPGVLMYLYGSRFAFDLAYIFHTKEALLALLWLLVFHTYNTHFNPRTFPVDAVFVTGTLSEERMRQEHPLELEGLRSKLTP